MKTADEIENVPDAVDIPPLPDSLWGEVSLRIARRGRVRAISRMTAVIVVVLGLVGVTTLPVRQDGSTALLYEEYQYLTAVFDGSDGDDELSALAVLVEE